MTKPYLNQGCKGHHQIKEARHTSKPDKLSLQMSMSELTIQRRKGPLRPTVTQKPSKAKTLENIKIAKKFRMQHLSHTLILKIQCW